LDENGEKEPDTERKDFVFTLGSGQNAYMFDDDSAGMKKGETIEFTKTYSPDDTRTTYAGLTKKLRVTLTELKEKKLPDLDDDLAQDIDEKYQTLDDLKNSIRERLENSLKRRIREMSINALLEKIMENTPVTLPESMVRVELDGRMRNLARQFGVDREKLMQMLQLSGGGLDDIEGKWRPTAEKALHSRLIVETLLEEQHIICEDEELDREIEAIAAEEGESFDEIERRFQENNSIEYLQDGVRERKFFDVLLAENTIKKGEKTNYLDVMGNNG
jgi:trigger factor